MRFANLFNESWKNIFDLTNNGFNIKLLPPEDQIGGAGIKKPEHVHLVKPDDGPILWSDH